MSNVPGPTPGPTPGPYDTGVGPTGMVSRSGRPDAYAGVPTMQRKGRPIAGAFAGLFFGFFLGVTLLLFGVLSVSGPWLAILTVGGIVLGALWGWWAPLGKREKPQAIPMATEPGTYAPPNSAQYYPSQPPGTPPPTRPVEPPPTQVSPWSAGAPASEATDGGLATPPAAPSADDPGDGLPKD